MRESIPELRDGAGAIPVIELGSALDGDRAARADVARLIDRACREVGFFVVTGHGVSDELIESLREAAIRFFDLPLESKKRYEPEPGSGLGGYLNSEALSYSRDDASPPDLKETYTVRRIGFAEEGGDGVGDQPNIWPDEVEDFERVVTEYFWALEGLAAEVMSLFALALELPESHFEPLIDRSISAMRMLHYPPVDEVPLEGQLRAGAHTDFGSLTLLLTDDAPGGLQVRHGGRWVDVPHIPGAFVVNLGDLMAQWTNDRWASTLHRVAVPPQGSQSRRLSVAFFHQPNDDAVIEAIPTCLAPGEDPKYPPVTSGEHLMAKVMKQRRMGDTEGSAS